MNDEAAETLLQGKPEMGIFPQNYKPESCKLRPLQPCKTETLQSFTNQKLPCFRPAPLGGDPRLP